MNRPNLATLKTCTGCLVCVDVCPKTALSKCIGEDGHIYIKCDESKCISCHKCEKVCPIVNEMKYSSNQLQNSIPFSLYCTDKKLYDKSTSGGAFIAIALNFIKNGGYVCGVISDNEVKHTVTNNVDEVLKMQGSKYVQSDMSGIYKTISKLIDNGQKVLFTGMGCQAAALNSYFKTNKNKENLFIIDLICGGVPSRLLSQIFLQNERQYTKIEGFRNKNQYVLSCYDTNGKLIYLKGQRVLPLYGFYSGLTMRYSCGDCRFCGIERMSDLTIGDYWGDNNGLHKSVAVAHTEKGIKILKCLNDVEINYIDWSFIKCNPRFVVGKSYNNHKIQRLLLPWLFHNLSYKSLCGFYGCNLQNPLWLLLHIYNHSMVKIQELYIKHQTKSILNSITKNNSQPYL